MLGVGYGAAFTAAPISPDETAVATLVYVALQYGPDAFQSVAVHADGASVFGELIHGFSPYGGRLIQRTTITRLPP